MSGRARSAALGRHGGAVARGAQRASLGIDGAVVTATAILTCFGVVMSYSTTAALALGHALPPHFVRHLGGVAAGIALAALATGFPLERWRRGALALWLLSLIPLVATIAMGTEVNGARRWLVVPGVGFRFQPGEIVKLTSLLAIASVLSRLEGRAIASPRALVAPAVLAGIPAALLLLQPDMGSAAVLLGLAGLLVFVAGAPLRLVAAPALLGAVGVAGYVALQPYALRRLTGFLQPWETASNEGYQLVQSFVAFGRGGPFGLGLGAGRQKLSYLPEAHTDFILSVIAEEVGLVGVLIVLGAFAALLVAGTRIARRARDRFSLLVAFGMTMLLTLPAALNAAVVMGAIPTKGLGLPFVSYGRTAILVSFTALGILLGIGRRAGTAAGPGFVAEPRRALSR